MQGMGIVSRTAAVVAVCSLMSAPLAGQTGEQAAAPTEAQLLAHIQDDPAGVAAYLDLAKLYIEQGRLDQAYELLARGLALVSEARQPQTAEGVNVEVPVRIGGDIEAPRKIQDVAPIYPAEAQAANVQGMVIVEVVVGRDGSVRDARLLRSVAMLDDAALDAVLQWRYTPTVLNGEPVEVIMTLTVNFTLKN
jgi:TonB family protein